METNVNLFDTLPGELYHMILSFLDDRERAIVAQVSHASHSMVNQVQDHILCVALKRWRQNPSYAADLSVRKLVEAKLEAMKKGTLHSIPECLASLAPDEMTRFQSWAVWGPNPGGGMGHSDCIIS
jgi:hypothetical protein